VLGGWLSTRFGGKWVFGIGVLCTAVLTLITPLVADNLPLFIVLRVLEGFGEGVTFPAMHGVWARWAPPAERTRLTTLSYSVRTARVEWPP
jgi:MFS family permease